MQRLHIIDAIGPFAAASTKPVRNWSKVPFSHLEDNGRLASKTKREVIANFETYLEKIVSIGYDSISIDDIAHLVLLPIYSSNLQTLLEDYRDLYKKVFSLAKKHKLKIFITTDYLFSNHDITAHLIKTGRSHINFFTEIIERALHDFPEIDGIILRVGENDGKDVEDSFLSSLLLKTPRQTHDLLQAILPIFERHDKKLIFRTWSVGVYELGDLIWNKRTFDAIFGSIKSEALIISMKFGDTDFMRYLALNPLLHHGNHLKIMELQTRREWEGMGMYPSFTGWDYEKYFKELSHDPAIIGIHVWCQTGGWAKDSWSNSTYLRGSSIWNELNTETTLRIYKHGESVDQAIKEFCHAHHISRYKDFVALLEQSEIATKKGLYIKELSERTLYFRRTRIPPLLWILWDKVLISPLLIAFLNASIQYPERVMAEAGEAVEAAYAMKELASKLQLDERTRHSIDFYYDTLVILADIRRYIFEELPPNEILALRKKVDTYTARYPQHYTIPKLDRAPKKHPIIGRALSFFIRTSPSYGVKDRIILNLSPLQRAFVSLYLYVSKSDLKGQSMGIESLFR